MTELAVTSKVCSKCGETKPLIEFYAKKGGRGGLASACKQCELAAVVAGKQRRREQMGEEAWLAHQRGIVRRHRDRTGSARDRAYAVAYTKALAVLRDRHRAEFEHLLLLAKRGELEHLITEPSNRNPHVANNIPATEGTTMTDTPQPVDPDQPEPEDPDAPDQPDEDGEDTTQA
jgi:hypothetical protein